MSNCAALLDESPYLRVIREIAIPQLADAHVAQHRN
jgi:hypothetical protein